MLGDAIVVVSFSTRTSRSQSTHEGQIQAYTVWFRPESRLVHRSTPGSTPLSSTAVDDAHSLDTSPTSRARQIEMRVGAKEMMSHAFSGINLLERDVNEALAKAVCMLSSRHFKK